MGKIFKTIWVGLSVGKVQVGLCQVTVKLSAELRSFVGGRVGRPTLAGNYLAFYLPFFMMIKVNIKMANKM